MITNQERVLPSDQTAEQEMKCSSASVYENMRHLLLCDPEYSKTIKGWSADEWYALYLEFGHVREAALEMLAGLQHCGIDTLLGLYSFYRDDADFIELLELRLVSRPVTELAILRLVNDHPVYFTKQLDKLSRSHTTAFSERKSAAETRLSLEKLFTAPARLETMRKISRVVKGIFNPSTKAERARPGLFDLDIPDTERCRRGLMHQPSLRLPDQNYTPSTICEFQTYKTRADLGRQKNVYQITYKHRVHYGVVRQSTSKDDPVFRPPRTIQIIENSDTSLEGNISFWGCWDSPCYIGLPHHSDARRPLSELEALITLADLNCMYSYKIKLVGNEVSVRYRYSGD